MTFVVPGSHKYLVEMQTGMRPFEKGTFETVTTCFQSAKWQAAALTPCNLCLLFTW